MQILDKCESVLVFRRVVEWVGKQPSPSATYDLLGFRTNGQTWRGKAPGTCIFASEHGRAVFPNGRPVRAPKAGVVIVTTLIGYNSGGWQTMNPDGSPREASVAHADYGAVEAAGLLGEFVGLMTPEEAADQVAKA